MKQQIIGAKNQLIHKDSQIGELLHQNDNLTAEIQILNSDLRLREDDLIAQKLEFDNILG